MLYQFIGLVGAICLVLAAVILIYVGCVLISDWLGGDL